jgi:hypothetical protein
MTKHERQFFKTLIERISNAGADGLQIVAPLIQNLSKYPKLSEYINNCKGVKIIYTNKSGGYSDGEATCRFNFVTGKVIEYHMEFSSHLTGVYKDEWWKPSIYISVQEALGECEWNGSEADYLKLKGEMQRELDEVNEVHRLKKEIAMKQQELAKMLNGK